MTGRCQRRKRREGEAGCELLHAARRGPDRAAGALQASRRPRRATRAPSARAPASSLDCGWLTRRPMSLAIVSVPSMSVGSSPASRAAKPDRPRRGKETGGGNELGVELAHRDDPPGIGGAWWASTETRGSPRGARGVSAHRRGGKTGTSGPITPASTTDAICGAAQLFAERRGGGEPSLRRSERRATVGARTSAAAATASRAREGFGPHRLSYRTAFPGRLDRPTGDVNEIRTSTSFVRRRTRPTTVRDVRRGLALLAVAGRPLGRSARGRRRDRREAAARRRRHPRREAARARRPAWQAGDDQRLVFLVKHLQQRGGRLRAVGSEAGEAVPLPRPERS